MCVDTHICKWRAVTGPDELRASHLASDGGGSARVVSGDHLDIGTGHSTGLDSLCSPYRRGSNIREAREPLDGQRRAENPPSRRPVPFAAGIEEAAGEDDEQGSVDDRQWLQATDLV